jgi:small GTP-binding protein
LLLLKKFYRIISSRISVLRRFFCDPILEVIEVKLLKLIKIAILGDVGVGKTTIRSSYLRENNFKSVIDDSVTFIQTVGVDETQKHITDDGLDILLHIADIGGEMGFFELNKPFLLGTQGALIVFDLNNPKSFLNIPKWINLLSMSSGRGLTPFLVLGNKKDLFGSHPRKVSETHIQRLMRKLEEISQRYGFKANFLEISGVNGTNIDKAFTEIVKMVITAKINYDTIRKFKSEEHKRLSSIKERNQEAEESPKTTSPGDGTTSVHLSSKDPHSTVEESSAVILITRDWEIVDEQYLFTVYIKNNSLKPISEVIVRLIEYPESLSPLREEMTTVTIPPGRLGTFKFSFTILEIPIIGKLRAEVVYTDHNIKLLTVTVHPCDVLLLSNLLQPLIKTNEKIAALLRDLNVRTSGDIDAWGKSGVMILEHLASILPKKNFQIIRKIGRKSDKGFVGRLLAGGSSKYSHTKIVLLSVDVIEHSKKNSSIRFEATSSDRYLSEVATKEFIELVLKEDVVPYVQEITIS